MMLKKLGHIPNGPNDPVLAQIPDAEFVECYRVFWNYLDLQRRLIMGVGVGEKERQDVAHAVEAFYEKWYPYGRL